MPAFFFSSYPWRSEELCLVDTILEYQPSFIPSFPISPFPSSPSVTPSRPQNGFPVSTSCITQEHISILIVCQEGCEGRLVNKDIQREVLGKNIKAINIG